MTRVNCEEYAHGHEISKLSGSPPGYVGHGIQPILSQQQIDAPHRRFRAELTENPGEHDGMARRIHAGGENECIGVQFDEIEKTHPTLWSAVLGILEDGVLTLGDNTTTDFTRSIILMTSNAGSREMGEFLERRPVGFQAEKQAESAPAGLDDLALAAAKREFPFEFINRFDEILVHASLEREHLGGGDRFLSDIHDRALRLAGVGPAQNK